MIKSVKSILTKDEKIICNNRVHWIVFSSPVLYGLIGLAVGIFFHPAVGGLILFMNLYPLYMSTVMYLTTHLVLTATKVLGRTGFLSRDWEQINLSRIESAYLMQPIIGRYLGYSTVVVSGTGGGGIAFPYIVDGGLFVKKLEKLLAEREEELKAAA